MRGKDIKTLAEILVDKYEPDVYNYGLLDLGFLICRYNHRNAWNVQSIIYVIF